MHNAAGALYKSYTQLCLISPLPPYMPYFFPPLSMNVIMYVSFSGILFGRVDLDISLFSGYIFIYIFTYVPFSCRASRRVTYADALEAAISLRSSSKSISCAFSAVISLLRYIPGLYSFSVILGVFIGGR